MKGGIFALSETFMKILSTAFLAIVLLSVFFSLNNYHLIYTENRADRESLVVGNIVLSSCLAETNEGYPVKSLLSEEKIKQYQNQREGNIDCLDYARSIYIVIEDEDNTLYSFGNDDACVGDPTQRGRCDGEHFSIFPAALNRTSEIVPVIVKVFIGTEEVVVEEEEETTTEPQTNCGNGICESGETVSCPDDCIADIDIFNNPISGTMYARSDTITTSYSIENTGFASQCFFVGLYSRCQCLEGDSYSKSNYVTLAPGETFTGSFSYVVGCDVTVMNAHDQLIYYNDYWTWNSVTSVYASANCNDFESSTGSLVTEPEYYQVRIVECLNDQDCINCPGNGDTCNIQKHICT